MATKLNILFLVLLVNASAEPEYYPRGMVTQAPGGPLLEFHDLQLDFVLIEFTFHSKELNIVSTAAINAFFEFHATRMRLE